MKRRAGFTLVELLIVMAVIAALMATLTPAAIGAVRRAKATQIATNLRSLGEAAKTYIVSEQVDLTASQTLGVDVLVPDYIDKIPDNYVVYASPNNNDLITIEAEYDGNDVPPARYFPDLPGLDPTVPKYVATAVKYW